MRVFDKNNDGVIDAAELSSVAKEIAAKEAAEREAQKEAARERKISRVFRRFALVLVIALLASVGINAGLTAGIVYLSKETKVGTLDHPDFLVSSDTGDVLKTGTASYEADLSSCMSNAFFNQLQMFEIKYGVVSMSLKVLSPIMKYWVISAYVNMYAMMPNAVYNLN